MGGTCLCYLCVGNLFPAMCPGRGRNLCGVSPEQVPRERRVHGASGTAHGGNRMAHPVRARGAENALVPCLFCPEILTFVECVI